MTELSVFFCMMIILCPWFPVCLKCFWLKMRILPSLLNKDSWHRTNVTIIKSTYIDIILKLKTKDITASTEQFSSNISIKYHFWWIGKYAKKWYTAAFINQSAKKVTMLFPLCVQEIHFLSKIKDFCPKLK